MLAVVTFLDKWHAYLVDRIFMQRVDNMVLTWLITYSMGVNMIG